MAQADGHARLDAGARSAPSAPGRSGASGDQADGARVASSSSSTSSSVASAAAIARAIVRARARRREQRPLEVQPASPRRPAPPRAAAKAAATPGSRAGAGADHRRQKRGHARRGQPLRQHRAAPSRVAADLEPEGAVALQIDEPGRDDRGVETRPRQLADSAGSDFHDPLAVDDERARTPGARRAAAARSTENRLWPWGDSVFIGRHYPTSQPSRRLHAHVPRSALARGHTSCSWPARSPCRCWRRSPDRRRRPRRRRPRPRRRPPARAPARRSPSRSRRRRSPNGLRVYVVGYDSPGLVAYYSVVRTGSRNEVEPGKSGFAHFFEHMMFHGTEKYSLDAYNAVIKEMGADSNAFTSDDLTVYHILAGKTALPKIVEIESDRFQHLHVPASPTSRRRRAPSSANTTRTPRTRWRRWSRRSTTTPSPRTPTSTRRWAS